MHFFTKTLKNQRQFDLVNGKATKYYSQYFIFIISRLTPEISAENSHIPHIYYGLKVSKKYSKKAVIRNKAKRRCRHLIKNLGISRAVNEDISIIMIPRRDFHLANFASLDNEVTKFYQKFADSSPTSLPASQPGS